MSDLTTNIGELLKNLQHSDIQPELFKENDDFRNYKNNAYNVVSTFGYLIGVDRMQFDSDSNPAMLINVYEKLQKNKNARIVRNLCLARNGLERYYMQIANAMRNELRNIDSVPDYIPIDAIWQLYEDGISLAKSHHDVDQYIIAINKEISNRVQNIQTVFPEWINFSYIRKLFMMPNGFTKEGIKEEGAFYNSNRNRYPYQVYMNWTMENVGNILYCDEKFVKLLYEYNEDVFVDLSLVRNAGDLTVNDINTFIEDAESVIFAVDCENSNPVKLASVLNGLPDDLKTKIKDVLLFDSHYTTEGWNILSTENRDNNDKTAADSVSENLFDWGSLESSAGVKMSHIVVDRLLESKSQVDMTLAVRTTQEVYKNGVDSVVLVSSDSDYWAMISNMPEVKFLVMMEREKTSPKIKESLDSKGIHHCFLDDFYTGVSYAIKTDTLKKYVQTYLDKNMSFGVDELINNAVYYSWIEMTDKEKKTFVEKYIKKAHVEITDNQFRIVLGEK